MEEGNEKKKEYEDDELYDELKDQFIRKMVNIGYQQKDVEMVIDAGIYCPDI